MIEHTYIEVMGWTLADPLTFISDLLMAAVCLFCGHRLYHDFKIDYAKYFGLFFLFLGISAFLGGTSHLLDVYVGKTLHLIAWLVQGLSILFVQLAAIKLIEKPKMRRWFNSSAFVLFGLFLVLLYNYQSFQVVKFNSTIGLIGFAFVFHLFKYFYSRNAAYLRVPMAICLFLIPAFIHGFDIYYNKWIDQNVISHLILLPCYYILYCAVRDAASIPKVHTQPLQRSEPQLLK